MARRGAVVIGGGLGGLAAALRLAARGWQVVLCEQDVRVGGKMNLWTRNGFRFDTGPSLITMPWIFQDLFADVGSRLEDHVELVPVRPLGRYVFADGTAFDYSPALPDWLATLRRLAPRDADNFFAYMRLGARLYELSRATFLRRPIGAPPDKEALGALLRAPVRHAWGNYHQSVAAHFSDPRLQQLFDRYPTFVGSSPYRCPATLSLIPFIEYAFGGWHVRGGLYRIVESLAALARERGVELRTQARVAAIEHHARRVTGVRLSDGSFVPARAVVMNGDVSMTCGMLGERERPWPPEERSLSGLVLLIGVRRRLPSLHHHNVFFSADYQKEFDQLFVERRLPDDPTVYISMPGKTDPSGAPHDGETLFVMANAPADDTGWKETDITEARRRIFARLQQSGFPDIHDDIVAETAITPRSMAERFGAPGGAIYGAHSHGWRRAFLRPPNKDPRYKGLYYAGGSAHPGGGTPIVLLSARIAVELVQQHESR